MRRIPVLLAAAAAACAPIAPPPPPPPSGPETVIREIAAQYRAIRSYAADVEFDVSVSAGAGVDTWGVRGRLLAARPLRYRWESETPVRVVAVCDGETAWTYLPDRGVARARRAADAVPRFPRDPTGTDSFPDLLLLPLLLRDDALDVLTMGARRFRLVAGGEEEGRTVEVAWADEEFFGGAAPEAATRYTRGPDGLVRAAEHEVSFASPSPARSAGETAPPLLAAAPRIRILVRERHERISTDAAFPDTAFVFEPPPGTRIVEGP